MKNAVAADSAALEKSLIGSFKDNLKSRRLEATSDLKSRRD